MYTQICMDPIYGGISVYTHTYTYAYPTTVARTSPCGLLPNPHYQTIPLDRLVPPISSTLPSRIVSRESALSRECPSPTISPEQRG